MILLCLTSTSHEARIIEQEEEEFYSKPNWNNNNRNSRRVIDVKGGPELVVWVVQLSDLHFSDHHPERARLQDHCGPYSLHDQPFSCPHHW
jgi:hypothetical protein